MRMRFSDWEPIYLGILEDFGFDRSEDEMSVRILKMTTINSDLIDDDEFQLTQHLDRVSAIFQTFADMACIIPAVVRKKRVEREFEETMDCLSSCVDGSNTCWCEDDVFLLCMFRHITQKSRFTRACFPSKEKRATGKVDNLECRLPLRIGSVYRRFQYRRSVKGLAKLNFRMFGLLCSLRL